MIGSTVLYSFGISPIVAAELKRPVGNSVTTQPQFHTQFESQLVEDVEIQADEFQEETGYERAYLVKLLSAAVPYDCWTADSSGLTSDFILTNSLATSSLVR